MAVLRDTLIESDRQPNFRSRRAPSGVQKSKVVGVW